MYLMWKRIYPKELIFMSQQDCLCNSIKTGYVPLSITHTQKDEKKQSSLFQMFPVYKPQTTQTFIKRQLTTKPRN